MKYKIIRHKKPKEKKNTCAGGNLGIFIKHGVLVDKRPIQVPGVFDMYAQVAPPSVESKHSFRTNGRAPQHREVAGETLHSDGSLCRGLPSTHNGNSWEI